MEIILNESEWAKKAIAEKQLGKKPHETLGRVARYYIDEGYNKNETKNKLGAFLISCDPNAILVKWEDRLEKIVKYALGHPINNIDCIEITLPEMNTIESLSGKQMQRLAFTLLCIAKYVKKISPESDYWISTPDNEIMRMANINTSTDRQSAMFNKLYEMNMIKLPKRVDSLSMQINFAQDGESVMVINDFRNLGYQYMKYHGEKFYVCERCGITCKSNVKSKKPQKYCADCAVKVRTEQNVNSVARIRMRAKTLNVGN